MLHLKLAAIHFQDFLRAAVEHFGERFHGLGLARPGWTQQQEDTCRPAFRRQHGAVHLNKGNNGFDCSGLTHQPA
jgi:hypothetical protein